jgi:hypothetical protein
MKRRIYTVEPIKHPAYRWVVREGKHGPASVIRWCKTKAEAITDGRAFARDVWKFGMLSQLRVKRRNGRIQFEHTYGADPARWKG